MSTLTNHYNIAVNSRFYAFLQEDMESTEPEDLIASAEKKREVTKENKTKAKKEKRIKQKETSDDEFGKIDAQVGEVKPEMVEMEKLIKIIESVPEEKFVKQGSENRSERSQRGRGSFRQGVMDNGSARNEERPQKDDSDYKPHNESSQRSFGNNRGRQYRRERTDDHREDSFKKVGYFDEQSQSGYRGGDNRRPYSRGGRFSRGTDRATNDDGNARFNTGEHKGISDETVERGNSARGTRARYPRQNRGGFDRSLRSNKEDEMKFEQNEIGHFEENIDNREYRGSGRGRGSRGMRRDRGDFHKPSEPESEDKVEMNTNSNAMPEEDNWDSVKDEINLDKLIKYDAKMMIGDNNSIEGINEDMWKKNPNECVNDTEDSPSLEVKNEVKETMTLEEWKALNSKEQRSIRVESVDTRKANDGQDVFCGMAQYKKGAEEMLVGVGGGLVVESHNEPVSHIRAKQTIAMSVRFSRSSDAADVGGVESVGEGRPFVGRGRDHGSGVNMRGSGGGRGRARGRTDYRGRGRGSRGGFARANNNSGGNVDGGHSDDYVTVNINLSNEEEFPQLS